MHRRPKLLQTLEVKCNRLFDDQVFPSLCRSDALRDVERMRRGKDNDLDAGIVEHLFQVFVSARISQVEFFSLGMGPLLFPADEGPHFGARVGFKRANVFARHPSCSHNSNAQFLHSGPPIGLPVSRRFQQAAILSGSKSNCLILNRLWMSVHANVPILLSWYSWMHWARRLLVAFKKALSQFRVTRITEYRLPHRG